MFYCHITLKLYNPDCKIKRKTEKKNTEKNIFLA